MSEWAYCCFAAALIAAVSGGCGAATAFVILALARKPRWCSTCRARRVYDDPEGAP